MKRAIFCSLGLGLCGCWVFLIGFMYGREMSLRKEAESLRGDISALRSQNRVQAEQLGVQVEGLKREYEDQIDRLQKEYDEELVSIRKQVEVLQGVLKGAELSKVHHITSTSYTACAKECGNDKGITCTGDPVVKGVTIGVSRDHRDWVGKWVLIKGLGVRHCTDLMDARIHDKIDIYTETRKEAFAWGSRKVDLVVLGKLPEESEKVLMQLAKK